MRGWSRPGQRRHNQQEKQQKGRRSQKATKVKYFLLLTLKFNMSGASELCKTTRFWHLLNCFGGGVHAHLRQCFLHALFRQHARPLAAIFVSITSKSIVRAGRMMVLAHIYPPRYWRMQLFIEDGARCAPCTYGSSFLKMASTEGFGDCCKTDEMNGIKLVYMLKRFTLALQPRTTDHCRAPTP